MTATLDQTRSEARKPRAQKVRPTGQPAHRRVSIQPQNRAAARMKSSLDERCRASDWPRVVGLPVGARVLVLDRRP
jgi:hypothetical protein